MNLKAAFVALAVSVVGSSSLHAGEIDMDAQGIEINPQIGPAPSSEFELSPSYLIAATFTEFRAKLIADGWVPVPNPDCHDAVYGGGGGICVDEPKSIYCRLCEVLPEIFRSTSDGYTVVRYQKKGIFLSVTLFGDIRDLDEPGKWGLAVTGWTFSESNDAALIGAGE